MIIKHVLTKTQESFIKKHKIPAELLVDAQGEGMTEELKQRMQETNTVFAYNTVGCIKDDNHNFKTIGGHCPQCEPGKIALLLRECEAGFIYIAGSRKGTLIKVGSTTNVLDRIKSLNMPKTKFAGFDDWVLLFDAKTSMQGRSERKIQQRLSENKVQYQVEKSGKSTDGGELYRCSYNKAKDAITALETEESFEFTQVHEKRDLIPDYQFKNLKARVQAVEA
ncbi:hypothetical protein TH53_09960 [Pedobacter lusitanus]|uniref:Bacteriophage T5 Orf172 DNA-binding domain-containing protein n=1 Tax=Pedobacter lusitanus TaxID=1503925 RepID=A0A0D0FXT9_9SPHI|nr:GIY-YIG nuclease family protein [Pedobacter lusitanus]KIO77324.1 hypothetical protein TH53_09960 [Pedobacter lusitanus]